MAVASTSGSSGNAFISSTLSKLWHNEPSVRLDASTRLVGFLAKSQQEQEEQELSSDVNYALRRLVRGLASPRDSSRLGFAVALTEVRMGSNYAKNIVNWLIVRKCSCWHACQMQTLVKSFPPSSSLHSLPKAFEDRKNAICYSVGFSEFMLS
jgi:hypothetical protein